jgi:hypothetical protein
MTHIRSVAVLAFCAALSIAPGAFAQQSPPPAAPAAAPAPAPAMKMDKKAISKQCSDQADAQSLHGKARKTFRSKCKMMGGKAA